MGAEEIAATGEEIFYVSKQVFEKVQEMLKASKDVSEDVVIDMTSPDQMADQDLMVPVDMREVSKDFEDVDEMLEKIGAKATAEAFVKAWEAFHANQDKEPEDERPQPITAGEWKEALQKVEDEEADEEALLSTEEGEEEEMCEDEEESVAGEDAEAGAA
eukprot:CAMPEP_0198494420 /NCGR_PEP_ID=MMETSP1462-20131121/4629_1 /TAXON_ID=1333877 /ORGANISM="Brandtodinium nutriculum, Strain RCC3387" /LENGTH=159 /DNA_ID=CAMNT_0044223159 /DNA_START=76 /DNA_END=551 /DNA_ORIENTATION=-